MTDTEQRTSKQLEPRRPIGETLLSIAFVLMCSCISLVCVLTVTASECPADDFVFRGLLKLTPQLPYPEQSLTIARDGAEGSHGGWTGGTHASSLSPEEVVTFLEHNGATCLLSTDNHYQLGGFSLDIGAQYWDCSVQAEPWSRGTVLVFPQAGYVNALQAIYTNPPPLNPGQTIDETIVGYLLSQFHKLYPDIGHDWPEGGSVYSTWLFLCDPL